MEEVIENDIENIDKYIVKVILPSLYSEKRIKMLKLLLEEKGIPYEVEGLEEDFSKEWWSDQLSEIMSDNQATINGQLIPLEIMVTPEDHMKGMMGRDSLDGGMLFPYDSAEPRSFHMKNCLIPLDIVFIVEGEIYNIKPNCPPCKEDNCPQFTGTADNVLELPGGYCQQNNINVGDYIKYPQDEPYGDTTAYRDYAKSNDPGPKTPVAPNHKYSQAAWNPGVYMKMDKTTLNELSDREIKFFATHADILKQLNTPNFKLKFLELFEELEGERLEALEYFWEEYFSNLDDSCEIEGAFDKKINEALPSQKLKTYGDIKNIVKSISNKQTLEKGKGIALDIIIDLLPGASTAKTTFDFVKAAFNKPDTQKTNTWIDRLDVDDQLSAIVDDTVENGFLKMMADVIEDKPDGELLDVNFSMNNELINHLKKKYKGRTVSIDELKYGGQHHLTQYMDQIKLDYGPQQYRDLQTLMSQQKDEEVNDWLKTKGYMNETRLFSKNWWLDIINESILTEGGAAGHMAHPFDLPDVTSGKDLKDLFVKAAISLKTSPGAVKIDGVNSSIRLVDLEGKKQFVMDRGSKKPLDIKGITKSDLEDRFKPGHGMVKVGGQVLDMFNDALPSIQNDLTTLGAWDDPNVLFNMEYVSGKTNVQDYGSNFIAIHGLNKMETKEVMGARKMLTKRFSTEFNYDKTALQSLLNNLAPIAKEKGFEVYGSVPTEMDKEPNFNSALTKTYTVNSNEGNKTQSLDMWLGEINSIPKDDFIFMNVNSIKKKVGAVSKQVYLAILQGENIDELFEEEDKQKAIDGFTTYLATEKLGDEILKVLNSPMGSVEDHEGVVIRDKNIYSKPFKITGKFILGGLISDF
jgi:uncharacterized membrane protein (UPF0127 family)